MKQWPAQHKNLAACMLFVIVACLTFVFLAIRPMLVSVNDKREELEEIQKKLREAGWPMRIAPLTALHESYRKRLEGTNRKRSDGTVDGGLIARSEEVLKYSTGLFKRKIDSIFGSTHDFMNDVSRLDYVEEFNQLEQRLSAYDIRLAEKVFGLSEDTAGVETYQLLLQVWTVDAVVRLLQKCNLAVTKEPIPVPTGLGNDVMASSIRVMPAITYVLQPGDKDPYVMEFPVRITLRGSVDDFMTFVKSLNMDDSFLALNRFEIFTENPNVAGRPGPDVSIQVKKLQAVVQCSAFFRPSLEAPKMRTTRIKMLPKGA